MEAVGDSRLRQKKTTAFFREGKGEKVVQETTSQWVITGLCTLGAASSRIPSSEGSPPDSLRWRVERWSLRVTVGVDK